MLKKVFFILFIVCLILVFLGYKNLFASRDFIKTKDEKMQPDGKAYLYKIKENNNKEEKFWYVATNKILEKKNLEGIAFEKVSENIFWDPEHCAQMLTLTVGNDLYFFESKFKLNQTNEFYDVIYKFDTKNNLMQTFESQKHTNLYSMIFENNKIFVFYKDGEEFYKTELVEQENKISFENKKIIKEGDIVYRNWKGNIESLDKIENLKYFIIQ